MSNSLAITFLLITNSLLSQSVSQIQLQYFKKFNDFWTGKKSNLGIEFHRITVKNTTDTLYVVFIKAFNQEYETVGVTSGISFSYNSLFGFASGGVSRTEALVRQKGFDTLSYLMCSKLAKIINNTWSYAKELDVRRHQLDHIVSDKIENIEFTIKYSPSNTINKYDYYFSVGEITFNMTEPEVIELLKFIKSILLKWELVLLKT